MFSLHFKEKQLLLFAILFFLRTYTIGRTDLVDIKVSEESISRKHAEITVFDESLAIKDLSSGKEHARRTIPNYIQSYFLIGKTKQQQANIPLVCVFLFSETIFMLSQPMGHLLIIANLSRIALCSCISEMSFILEIHLSFLLSRKIRVNLLKFA